MVSSDTTKALLEEIPVEGDQVEMTCYKGDCELVVISVTLGREYLVTSGFARQERVGRINWSKEAKLQSFDIKQDKAISSCRCPNCGTYFGNVIAVSEPDKKAFFIGYESDSDRWGEVPAHPRTFY